ncbi:MAG: transporter substrate-binding domain-containing protein [Micromonosporaceae bacterium]|nr:transporter substrate-binding domain-containing protein [Micromonosporaceae bacterium]
MRTRKLAALAAIGALALGACGTEDGDGGDGNGNGAPEFEAGTTMAELSEAGTIRVGTKYDQNGFGLVNLDGVPEGFDVEIAKIIATELGIPEDGIVWSEAPSAVREEVLERDEVDIVVATYTINDERKERIDFAGPYYIAGQHIMVAADDDSITGPESFQDGEKTVCSVQGSTPSENIRPFLANEDEQLVLFDVYSRCADALTAGDVDAVTTDNVILLGFIADDPEAFKLVEEGTFTDEPYGIGVQKGDDEFRSFINDVLEEIVADGRYNEAWDATAGQFDPNPPTPPTVDRY